MDTYNCLRPHGLRDIEIWPLLRLAEIWFYQDNVGHSFRFDLANLWITASNADVEISLMRHFKLRALLLTFILTVTTASVRAGSLDDFLQKTTDVIVNTTAVVVDKVTKKEEEEAEQDSKVDRSTDNTHAIPTKYAMEPSSPVILTVDGIESKMLLKSLGNVAAPEGRLISYLDDHVADWPFVEKKYLYYVPWSGAIKDTESTVRKVEDEILRCLSISKNRNRRFVIVAHSWGGVLVSDALANLRWENRIPDDALDLLVTIGTPVQNKTILAAQKHAYTDDVLRAASGAVKRWNNYHNKEDWISSDFGYEDRVFTTLVSGRHEDDHRVYYMDESVWSKIGGDALTYLKTLPVATISTKFELGDQVETVGNLNVRQTAGGDLLGTHVEGTRGTIIGGPYALADHVYWEIDFEEPEDGWSAERYLQVASLDSSDRINGITPTTPPNKTSLSNKSSGEPHLDLYGLYLGMRAEKVATLMKTRIEGLVTLPDDWDSSKFNRDKTAREQLKMAEENFAGTIWKKKRDCVGVDLPSLACIEKIEIENFVSAEERHLVKVFFIEDYANNPGINLIYKVEFDHYYSEGISSIDAIAIAKNKYGSPGDPCKYEPEKIKKRCKFRRSSSNRPIWWVGSPLGLGIINYFDRPITYYGSKGYSFSLSLTKDNIKERLNSLEAASRAARSNKPSPF